MKTLIVGDIHGNFKLLASFIEANKPELVIQLGDFGYWPELTEYIELAKLTQVPVWFIDGNHENHEALKAFQYPIFPGCLVEYVKRGETRTLPDGRTALFMGGAFSIDKHLRIPGFDWFPEETIKLSDIQNISCDKKIDVLFAHTCSKNLHNFMVHKCGGLKISDPSSEYLQILLDKYQPDLFYFSHWHISAQGVTDKTKWFCLDKDAFRWLD